MDAHNAVQRIVAILVIVLGTWGGTVYADQVYTYGGDFNLPLLDPNGPGSAMTEAIIEIPHHFIIADLDVRINITHTNVFDLQIFLQGPGEPSEQTRLCLNKYEFYEFFDGEDYTQTIFDDEAPLPIEQGQPPFTGRFRPEVGYLLEIYDGTDAFGSWRLQIYDMYPVDTGTLDSFELIITTPEPTTAALLIFGMTLVNLFRPNRGR